MKVLVRKVISFLIETVWSRIDVWRFLRAHKHYLIMAISNLILSLLFIYMVEQVTVRTDQYRAVKTQLVTIEMNLKSLEKENQDLEEKVRILRQTFDAEDRRVEPNTILKDYDQWTQELEALNQEVQWSKIKESGEPNATGP